MKEEPTRRPGDILLDAIIPNATPEERERAHDELRELAGLVVRIYARHLREADELDSLKSGAQGTIDPSAPV